MHQLRKQDGFTLIELMIAMLVMIIALLSYLSATNIIQDSGEAAFERSIAVQDANQVFERMRNSAKSGTFPSDLVTTYPNNGTVAGFNNLANETITVSYVDTTADPLDTSIVVTWLEDSDRNTSITLRSFITQR